MTVLSYRVAELDFVIHSPQAEDLGQMLYDSYNNFRIHQNESPLLFELYTEQKVEDVTDGKRLLECGGWFHLKTATYQIKQDTLLIEMQVNEGKTHRAYTPDNWRHIYSDISGLNKEELICLKAILTTALSKRGAKHGLLKLHASAVQVSGEALAFIAPSGTGKSTHSKLWLKHIDRAELLNDDEPLVRIFPDKVKIYGAPWSGSTPCYKDMAAQLQAIVHLKQAQDNHLHRCSSLQALSHLFESVAILRWDQEHRKEVYKLLSDLLNIISVYHLDCNISVEAVALSQQLLHTPNSSGTKQG